MTANFQRDVALSVLFFFGVLLSGCTTADSQYKDLPVEDWPSQQTIRSIGKDN
ncbi:hypothetical protein L1787_00335 [Acuticoccus sp. M5D2P5]|uniref:hypothetical protein n=1 Tax=Acuticoccus kalidii TaxID=2910977 RepID=UPI001F3D7CA6|nr:hypothetical protein [Acuticoccus kalidii]MCF3931857.1 hypothetical protein [Acuticoccus kalidii]